MKYSYRTQPRAHQVRALKFLLKTTKRRPVRGGGLQVPMRWGKTKTAIDFAGCLALLENVQDVLVITVTDGVEVWHNEIDKHCAVPYVITSTSPPREGWPMHNGEDVGPLAWHVVNFANVFKREPTPGLGMKWVAVDNPTLVEFAADLVIVDEGHHLGNPTTLQSKHAYQLGRRARFRLLMTGTMFHRKPQYIFGQAKFIDHFIFGTAWTHFRERTEVMSPHNKHVVLRYKNLKWVMGKLKPWVFMEEYVPPGKPVVNLIPTPLTGRNAQAYHKMEKESLLKLGDGVKVSAEILLTRHLRCQQICGGWMRTTDGEYLRAGRCKLDVAESRLREYLLQDITKAVIGCRFLPEIRDLAELARKIGFVPIVFHGGIPKGGERARRIAAFQRTSKPCLFIAQHRAAREAIDLSAASVMMLYSLPEGFLTYDQFTSRIELFDDKRTLMYDILLAPGTRDEVAWEALQQQADVATYIAKNPERVEAIVAANADRKYNTGG